MSHQLTNEKIDILLINGKGATDTFLEYFKPKLIKSERLIVANKTCNIYQFDLLLENKKIKIFAWSNNLQSTIGLTNEMKKEIGNWIGQ